MPVDPQLQADVEAGEARRAQLQQQLAAAEATLDALKAKRGQALAADPGADVTALHAQHAAAQLAADGARDALAALEARLEPLRAQLAAQRTADAVQQARQAVIDRRAQALATRVAIRDQCLSFAQTLKGLLAADAQHAAALAQAAAVAEQTYARHAPAAHDKPDGSLPTFFEVAGSDPVGWALRAFVAAAQDFIRRAAV